MPCLVNGTCIVSICIDLYSVLTSDILCNCFFPMIIDTYLCKVACLCESLRSIPAVRCCSALSDDLSTYF